MSAHSPIYRENKEYTLCCLPVEPMPENEQFLQKAFRYTWQIPQLNKNKSYLSGHYTARKALDLVLPSNEPSIALLQNPDGKPLLNLPKKVISLSHGPQLAGAVIAGKPIGLDIEAPREQLLRIQDKFLHPSEVGFAKGNLDTLTHIWTAKEAIYKLISQKGLSFKENIYLEEIHTDTGLAIVNHLEKKYIIHLDYYYQNDQVICVAKISN
ncbi:MAG: 4'-phosphopantetheinyl transferase superfamily protein [Cyclobacteriaceae bacterium]|nr:4'-phosphopantetheinyl transferase superfamily protein [Cyclobacteriaceae bacterium]MCH8515156.1 4'-phosphopantetheinyl transferase superfamily protein [Cyclobacteriaceae bacterium]